MRDVSKSSKKSKKKKFLEEELEKILQKKYFNEESRMNEIKINNSNELLGLRGDLKEMKDVISKLSSDDWYSKKEVQEQPATKEEYEVMFLGFQKKIEELIS